jgi:hypothetical protein
MHYKPIKRFLQLKLQARRMHLRFSSGQDKNKKIYYYWMSFFSLCVSNNALFLMILPYIVIKEYCPNEMRENLKKIYFKDMFTQIIVKNGS